MHDIGLRPGEKLHEEMISPGGGPPRPAARRPLRAAARPRLLGLHSRRPTASRSPTASPTAPTPTTSGSPGEEIAKILETGDLSAMLPYGRQSISEDDVEAVAAVLRGDWLTTGPGGRRLRGAASPSWPAATAVVSCTSGTAALHIAYAALGRRPRRRGRHHPDDLRRDRERAPSMLGATVVFADVEADTGNLDPDAVEPRWSATAPGSSPAVDYAGHPCDYAALQAIADRVGAVHARRRRALHRRHATTAARSATSPTSPRSRSSRPRTSPPAEGGAVVAPGPGRGRARPRVPQHRPGPRPGPVRSSPDEGPWHQEVHEFGLNYRLTDVLAAPSGCSQLRRLAGVQARRRRDHTRATTRRWPASTGCGTPPQPRRRRPGLAPLPAPGPRRPAPRGVRAACAPAGIGVQVNYLPVYWHPVYADLGYRRGMCPNAEAFYAAGALAAAVPRPHRRPGRPGRRDADRDPALT